MKKKNTGFTILLIITFLLLLCFIGYVVYDNTLARKNNSKTIIEDTSKTEIYTYSDVAGYYSLTKKIGEKGQREEATYELYLFEDGTFKSEFRYMTASGYMGNYIIENNIIKLNYLFESNSGEGLSVARGTVSFDILGKKSISSRSSLDDDIDFSGTLINSNVLDLKYHNLYEILNEEPVIESEASKKTNNQ